MRDLKRRPEIRERVFQRDLYLCRLSPFGSLNQDGRDWGPCFGIPQTPHHLLKEVHGGEYTLDNLVTLCSGHNQMVEDYPDAAHAIGLVIYSWEAR
jgi:hypothetical protein